MSKSIDSMAAGAPSDSRLKLPAKSSENVTRIVDEERDAEFELEDTTDPKPKKKRRVTQSSDKKYECPTDDCGKSYSRAEHLYRHQLNHAPKQIYRCDHPGCDRYFVRADLCARHKERHTAKGSHLQRKDAFLKDQNPQNVTRTPNSPPSASDSNAQTSQTGYNSRDGEKKSSGDNLSARVITPSLSDQSQQRSDSVPGLIPTLSNSSVSADSGVGISGQASYNTYANGPSQGISVLPGSESPHQSREPWLYGKSTPNLFEPPKDGFGSNAMQNLPRQPYNNLPYVTPQIQQQPASSLTPAVGYQMSPPLPLYSTLR